MTGALSDSKALITALSVVEPSLATPLDPNPKPKRKRRQSYSEIERTTALMTAALVGVKQASDDLGIPKRTIYTWFDEAGGYGPMRDAARTAIGATMFAAAMVVCVELIERIPSMDVNQLLEVLKVLTANAPKSLAEGSGQGGAAATKPIQVVFQETGEVIDLDATVPDRRAGAPPIAR